MNKPYSVLIVEDDANLNRGVGYALEKENYRVFSAENIANARRILKEETIRLMILDLNLPTAMALIFAGNCVKPPNCPF